MEIRQVQPSSENAQSDATRGKPTRRRFTGDAHIPINKRVRVPAIRVPAIFHLKKELRLRSDGDIIHWLIHELRPELLPAPEPSNSPRSRPICNSVNHSVPKPVCMEYLNDDKDASYLPVASGSAPAKGKPVRATVVQASTVLFDTPATLDKAERLIAGAAAYGSQLVVFPEAFLGGYPQSLTFDSARDDLQKYYTSAIDVPGPEVDWLAKIADKYKVHLVMGVVERAGFYLFSTLLFFDSLGQRLGQHRKLMPMASEKAVWYSGQKSLLPVYETSIGKIGGLVCWDNKSPLLRTELYAKGVEIYCAPSADAREIWKSSMIHIAVEGGCFVLSANQFCRSRDNPLPSGDSNSDKSLDVITSGGGSIIVSQSGTVLAGPNYQKECLISADLELSEIERARTEFGTIGNSIKPDHVDWCASELNPILLATDIKIVVPNDNELSG